MTGAGGRDAQEGDQTAVAVPGVRPPLRSLLRLGGLAVLVVWTARVAVIGQAAHPIFLAVALGVAVLGWLGWTFAPVPVPRSRVGFAVVLALAVAGGAITLESAAGLAFVAAAGVASALSLDLPIAAALAAVAPTAAAAAALVLHKPLSGAVDVAAVALVGLLVGVGRRDYQARLEHTAALRLERERQEIERARGDVLAERNRLAREMHDVLAHSLGALSVELEALDTVMEAHEDPEAVRARVARVRRMVQSGLEEARRAVRALREDPTPLAEQVRRLASEAGAAMTVEGTLRPLAPEAGMAIYRAAQEALTNARRHAPGEPAHVTLAFAPAEVVLTVTNGLRAATPVPAEERGGFGLQGMRERALLLGGSAEAGPSAGDDWCVRVRLPL